MRMSVPDIPTSPQKPYPKTPTNSVICKGNASHCKALIGPLMSARSTNIWGNPYADLSLSSPNVAQDVLFDLALQGGGAQGAFTSGVLDRLLDEICI